jgi:hypothetical protein
VRDLLSCLVITESGERCPLLADTVAKVENRTTPKMSRKLIFGFSWRCVAFSATTEVIADGRVSPAVCSILDVLARQYSAIGIEIVSIDKSIMALHRACEASRRLAEIPGIGPIGATARSATGRHSPRGAV